MQAVLNGLTGAGLLIEGDRVSVLRIEGDSSLRPGQVAELPRVLGEGRNVEFVGVADAEQALQILRRDQLREECLDLALILLDPELSAATRTEAAALLNHMLMDWELRSWLEGVLYGAPLPSGADLDGAVRYARDVGGNALIAMLSSLASLQGVIARVHEAWNSVCQRVLPSSKAAKEATVLAARNGIFRHLVHGVERANTNEFRFAALSVLRPLAGHRQIVEEVIRELQVPSVGDKASRAQSSEDGRAQRSRDGNRRDDHYLSFDRTSAFESVKRQKDAIVSNMRAARFDLVDLYVDQLVEYQLPLDHRGEYTSKSLCDLAMEAKSLELHELQLALALRAVEVRYEDGWAWAQVGDASLILNRFDLALTAYEHASEFDGGSIGRTGLAHVLLRMGRLEDALAAHNDVVSDFPTNVFAQNGRAEVLKSLGRFDDALAAYNDVVRDFPTNVVAQTGRAELIKSMERLDDALAAYNDVVRDFPTNVIAQNGRAEVLKSLGRLDDALAAYNDVVRDFPTNVVAQTGRAEVLKSLGRFDDALAAYNDVVRDSPTDVVAQNGRAEVLKSLGRLDDALDAYNVVVRDFPTDAVAKNGRAEVLKSLGRLDDALDAYNVVVRDFPTDVFAQNGRAEVLKSLGRLDDALAAYNVVVRDFPTNVVAQNGRAEVLKSLGRLDDALAAYNVVVRDFPTNVVPQNGRSEVLKSLGRFDDALAAYNDVVSDFPTDVVAQNGRAEVLKSLGRLDDALAAYGDVVRDFPTNVVAQTGRAEVLRSMGRLDDALAAYNVVVRDFPTDVVAQTGRAEVLKSLGLLDDALAAYNDVVRDFPTNVVAQNGRAAVLCALGKHDEALAALPTESPRTRQDWIGFHIRGMALLRARRIDEASEIFLRGADENPFVGDRDRFRSGLALTRLHLRAYDAALDILSNVHSITDDRVSGFLRGHGAGALGDRTGAARFLSTTGPARNDRERELKAELERRFVRRVTPLHDEEWLIEQELDCVLLAA